MNVVCSLCPHELEMAHRWFDWVAELGGTQGHRLFLIPTSETPIEAVIPKASAAFKGRFDVIKDYEGETSDWQQSQPARSAAGPNSSFRQVAWHFFQFKLGPWFWCEFDCIPTQRDWLDRLEAQYRIAVNNGKPFMGARVLIDRVPEHMSGNAVYPQDVPAIAPSIVMRAEWTPKGTGRSFELAFDIAGAKEVIPQAFFTDLIQHKFRYDGFKSRQEFDAVLDPNAVVFHSDKKGTIYRYLRENLGGSQTVSGHVASGEPTNGSITAPEDRDVGESPHETAVSRSEKTPTRDELLKATVATLKKFCTSPEYTSKVRKELKRQKVIR